MQGYKFSKYTIKSWIEKGLKCTNLESLDSLEKDLDQLANLDVYFYYTKDKKSKIHVEQCDEKTYKDCNNSMSNRRALIFDNSKNNDCIKEFVKHSEHENQNKVYNLLTKGEIIKRLTCHDFEWARIKICMDYYDSQYQECEGYFLYELFNNKESKGVV